MASKRCPACGLVNPASAERCDCGRSFVDGSVGANLADRLARPRARRPRMPASAWVVMGLGVALEIAGFVADACIGPHFESSGDHTAIVSGSLGASVLKLLGGAIAITGYVWGRIARARAEREADADSGA